MIMISTAFIVMTTMWQVQIRTLPKLVLHTHDRIILNEADESRSMKFHGRAIHSFRDIISISAAQTRLLIIARHADSPREYGLYIFDPQSNSTLNLAARFPFTGLLTAAISYDGDSVVVGHTEGALYTLTRIEINDNHVRSIFVTNSRIRSVAWSKNKMLIALGQEENDTLILDATTGSEITHFSGTGAAWAPDSRRLALYHPAKKSIEIIDINSGNSETLMMRKPWQNEIVGPLFWNPDDDLIAFATPSGTLGYDLKCNLVDARTRKIKLAKTVDGFCGPWF